ncbi:hypothetical protein [Hymenobacter psychrophilus]|uniref:Uncharacterized protein n=1 Tax=Hymenobacter psychrophilus TaxID=651662 RepID=A0A1H3M1R9_9BACT|nr:hypothetical protein [Hymenobacter psychrophilus]SDY70660.1 hypothetical protein SAMN04488069_11214 [Hymenobacter psychrophilus]
MARVKMELGSGIAGLSGRIGNLVFRIGADGTTYAQQAPSSRKRPGSAAQQQHRKRFGAAAAYGRTQQASAEGRAYYQPFVAAGRFASVYRVALADYLKPPQLRAVEAGGYHGQAKARLRIQACNPCGVAAVWVSGLNATGQVLEEGLAAPEEADWWVYQTTHSHPAARQLQVAAQDRPGNTAEIVVDLE